MAEYKVLRVRIYATDADALNTLPLTQMDRGCMGGVRRQPDGGVVLEALVAESLMENVTDRRLRLEVVGDILAESRSRQREVGEGNRFTGENWIPRGLGKKVREVQR